MECTGVLKDVSKDWKTGKYIVSFGLEGDLLPETIEELQGYEKLAITAKKYRQKRSLDANAYAWVLMTKIAQRLRSTKEEVYEALLQDYGPLYQDEEGYLVVTVKSSIDMSKVDGHWKRYKESKDGKFTSYFMIKGSSEYDTKEMADFIDHVIDAAKGLGIETMTPAEIERLKADWKRVGVEVA